MSVTSVAAAVSSKAAAVLAAAAMVAAGGSLAAIATTGSVDPSVWHRAVTGAVAACRADLRMGDHGIGLCVSAVATSSQQTDGPPRAGATPSTSPRAAGLPTPARNVPGRAPPGHGG